MAAAPTTLALGLYLTLMATFGWALFQKRRTPAAALARAPRVSVLKPLAGADDELYENLESFAAIDYPAFEVLLGVARLEDPAVPLARAFLERHPSLDGRIVITDRDLAVNPKVAQLIALDRVATGEVLVVSDSNVRVGPSYLSSLVAELDRPGVGLVTSIFVGTGERTLGAALENLQLGGFTAPGVVAAAKLVRRPFTVGKSMAMWRRDVVRLAALHLVGHVLAEDHLLGRLFDEAGYAIRTSLETIENRNVDCSLRRTLERHTRWAKMRRAISPAAFALEPLLCPLAVASTAAVVAPCRTTVLLLAFAALVQTALAFSALRLLRGTSLRWYYAPLEVLRSYVALFCWARAWSSRRIQWRGHAFLLARDSAIVPVAP